MIITIDGPAGSGKSSTARAVAARLGFRHLDSGAFYRALTLAALRRGLPAEQWDALTRQQLDDLGVQGRPGPEGYRLFIGDEDVTTEIRSAEVNANVSRMARVPAVRAWLLDRLRDAAANTDLVADGRDMGTVVFPDADLKVFLVAALETRAIRKLRERGIESPGPEQIEAEVQRLAERDRLDTERAVAPLRQAPDAIRVDTTDLTFDQQVSAIVDLARARTRA